MNAKDFFSESVYEDVLKVYNHQEVVDVLESPFKKVVRANGNSYQLLIWSGHYHPSVFNGAYFLNCSYDFNHKGLYDGRYIYGSSIKPDMSSYQAFCKSINDVLKKTPDYQEDEEEQLTFF